LSKEQKAVRLELLKNGFEFHEIRTLESFQKIILQIYLRN
jgi:hypothetical protein